MSLPPDIQSNLEIWIRILDHLGLRLDALAQVCTPCEMPHSPV